MQEALCACWLLCVHCSSCSQLIGEIRDLGQRINYVHMSRLHDERAVHKYSRLATPFIRPAA